MKRRALFTSGLTAFAVGAAISPVQAQTNGSPRRKEYDLVILGCGCAGLAAAIEAADRGGKVAILEKMPVPFGNTIYAGGNFNATNTWVQKRDGIKDTVDDFYKDMMAVSLQRGDPKLTRIFCEESADVVQWLTDRLHLEWKPIDVQIAPMLGRCHEIGGKVTPGGSQLIKNALEEAKKLGVDIYFNTKAVELLKDDSLACLGARAIDKNGPIDFLARGGVLICTGGFHSNKEMVTRYMGGDIAWMPLRGSAYLTGENITLTQPFFPQYVNMDQFHGGPIHGQTKANPSNMVNFGICLNPRGERYVDENSTYVAVAKATPQRIKENQAYILIDSSVVPHPIVARRIKRYDKAKAQYFVGDDLAQVSKEAGLPPEQVLATVAQYNQAVKNGKGAELIVPNTMEKPFVIEKPPFYIFPFMGGMTATFGGPKFNEFGQLLNTENKPIPGLFGAGNAVGGLFYDNYLDGSQLTAAVIWGRRAARKALENLKTASMVLPSRDIGWLSD